MEEAMNQIETIKLKTYELIKYADAYYNLDSCHILKSPIFKKPNKIRDFLKFVLDNWY